MIIMKIVDVALKQLSKVKDTVLFGWLDHISAVYWDIGHQVLAKGRLRLAFYLSRSYIHYWIKLTQNLEFILTFLTPVYQSIC